MGVNGTLLGVAATMLVALLLCGQYLFANGGGLGLRETVAAPALALAVTAGGLAGGLLVLPAVWPPLLRLGMVGITALLMYAGVMMLLRPHEMRERLQYLRLRWRRAPDPG
jgi:hypothetical protein